VSVRPTSDEPTSGDLGRRPLAVSLALLAASGATGTLALEHDGRRAAIVVREGRVSRVETNEPVAYLGGVLYELGAIDVATLDDTLREVARARRLHGEVLLERGAITEAQLDAALVEQTCRKAAHLFTLPDETRWTFDPRIAPARDEDRPSVDAWRVIWRGLRELPLSLHALRTLARVDCAVQLRDRSIADRAGLSGDERAIAERLAAQPLTLPELFGPIAPNGTERAERLVYFLVLARALARVELAPIGPAALGADAIRARARTILDEDPFVTLGLPDGASTEAVRAAYFRLARLWHPDKLPASLAEVRAECEVIFASLGDAHRILTSPGSRALAMMRSVAPGPTPSVAPERPVTGASPRRLRVVPRTTSTGAPRCAEPLAPARGAHGESDAANDAGLDAAAEPAALAMDKALARGDLDAAAGLASAIANAGSYGPDARAVLAWCGAHAGDAPREVLERAIAALDRVISGDPECARALFYRGQLHKRLGHGELAARDFRKVTRIDPCHLDAAREVRLFEMRTRTSASDHTRAAAGRDASARASRKDSASMHAGGSGLRRLMDRALGK
jgi:hypothetical protein